MELIPKNNPLMQLYLKTQQRQSTPPTRVQILQISMCAQIHTVVETLTSKRSKRVRVHSRPHRAVSTFTIFCSLSFMCTHTSTRACSFKSVWWKLTWATAPFLCWTAPPSAGSAPGSDQGRVADNPSTHGSQFFWARPSLSVSLHAIR